MKAILFAGADIDDYDSIKEYICDYGFVICCDSGIRHAKRLNIMPDYLIGDFDSADISDVNEYKRLGVKIEQFPTKKDETDLQLGLYLAGRLNADEVDIFGGIGSRFDHTLANAYLLYAMHKKGIKARLISPNNCIEIIDSYTEIKGKKGDLVSVLPLSMRAAGITTYNLEYPLKDAALEPDSRVIAVSNVMTEDVAAIDIKEGCLFLMKCTD